MLALSGHTRIFVYTATTDFRKGFNGLSGLVAEHFDVELLSGHLFLFFNRRRDSIKILAWDRDGLILWYKRLESGTFQCGALQGDTLTIEIDSTKLALLLSGIDIASARRRKRYKVA
jgi:transposase